MPADGPEPSRMICDKRQAASFRAHLIEQGRSFQEEATGESEVTFILDPVPSPFDDLIPLSSPPNPVAAESFSWNGAHEKHPRCLDAVQRTVDSEFIDQSRSFWANDPFLVPILPNAYSCEISCTCGETQTRLLTHTKQGSNGPLVASPLALDCAACGKVTEFFDLEVHGYGGEYGLNEKSESRATRSHWECPSCDGTFLKLNVLLYYQISPPEDEEDEMAMRPQDFFDGFSLNGQCLSCMESGGVAWFDCT